eukprot:m.119398 g.119398  ORF g.119398 m.119398 type:complete len:56 (-) comp15588_c0_seq7:241-408(-)
MPVLAFESNCTVSHDSLRVFVTSPVTAATQVPFQSVDDMPTHEVVNPLSTPSLLG